MVHSAQHKAPKPTQNTLLVTPTRDLARVLISEKEEGFQETRSQDLTQGQTNLAKTQLKKMCLEFSKAPHKLQNSEPGPLRFLI